MTPVLLRPSLDPRLRPWATLLLVAVGVAVPTFAPAQTPDAPEAGEGEAVSPGGGGPDVEVEVEAGGDGEGGRDKGADPEERPRIYRTREERRDAGKKRELTPWLTISGLMEVEYIYHSLKAEGNPWRTQPEEFSPTLQFDLEATPAEWFKLEVVYEYDHDTTEHILDEVIGAFEAGPFELEVGEFFMPFGEYYSHFVVGPLVEFGETRGRGAALSYAPGDELDLKAYVYDGKAHEAGSNDGEWAWGVAAEISPTDTVTLGLGYLSDLADSDEEFLADDGHRYRQAVPALNSYAVLGMGKFEVTAEAVAAIRSFHELDPDRDRPVAWNLELAYYPEGDLSFALRLEGSREFEDAPEVQGGVAVSWAITPTTFFSADFLLAQYKRGLAEDEDGNEVRRGLQVGTLLTIEF